MEDMVLFVLSVSGETPLIVSSVDNYKKKRMKVISLTNTDICTINFAYFMPLTYVHQTIEHMNITTQIPVIYLLETLSQWINDIREKQKR